MKRWQYGVRWRDDSVSARFNGRSARARALSVMHEFPGGVLVRRRVDYLGRPTGAEWEEAE